MVTSHVHPQSRAEARGHLQIAQTYILSGSTFTRDAVDHLSKVLEYILDQMDESQPERSTDRCDFENPLGRCVLIAGHYPDLPHRYPTNVTETEIKDFA